MTILFMTTSNFKTKLFNALTLMFVFAFIPMSVQAQTGEQKAPDQVVKDTVDAIVSNIQANRAVYQKDSQELFKMVEETLVPGLHIPRMAKLVLGREAAKNSTAEQRAAFAAEFQTFLINVYAPALLEYTGNEKVTYEDTDLSNGKDKVKINGSLTASNGQVYPIVLSMSNRGDTRWRAFNMEIAGIDFVRTYRSSFEPILAKKGIDGLIADLREKNSK